MVARSLETMSAVLEQHVQTLVALNDNPDMHDPEKESGVRNDNPNSTERLKQAVAALKSSISIVLTDVNELQGDAGQPHGGPSASSGQPRLRHSVTVSASSEQETSAANANACSPSKVPKIPKPGPSATSLGRTSVYSEAVSAEDSNIAAHPSAIAHRKPPCSHRIVIYPAWTSKLAWDLAVMLVVLVDAFVLPYQLSFKRDLEPDAFDEFWFWITTSFFTLDIVATFDTALGGDEDDLIVDHRTIARAYLRGWFFFDWVSTMPWSRMVDAMVSDTDGGALYHVAKLAKMLKFLRIIRLMKMLRARKIKDIWERVETRIGSVTVIQAMYLVRVLLVIVAICHWNACIFWIIGRTDSIITDFLPDDTRIAFEGLEHWTMVWHKYGVDGEPWRFHDKPIVECYVFCFYWTLGVMRTMPAEVTPVNLLERIFVLCFMFFALSAFAVSVASLTQAYFKISERNRSFNDEMFAIRMHMHKLKLEDHSQRRIKDYITHRFNRRRMLAKEVNIVDNLPKALQNEVKYATALQYVQRLSVIADLSKDAIKKICLEFEPKDYLPETQLCVAGHEASVARLLCAGTLSAKDINQITVEVPHDAIIDEACLETEEPVISTLTVTTVSTCEILTIDKLAFARITGMHLSDGRRRKLKAMNSKQGPDQVELNRQADDSQSRSGAAAAAAAVVSS